MILLETDFLNHPKQSIHLLEDGQNYIYDNINIQKKLKFIILNHMKNFNIMGETIYLNSTNKIYIFLENLKESLNLCNNNISLLESLLSKLNSVIESTQIEDTNTYNIIKDYNLEFCKCMYSVNNNILKINNCLCVLSENCELKTISCTTNKSAKEEEIESINTITFDNQNNLNKTNNEQTNYKTSLENDENFEYTEDTLIISEESSKVILPFSMSEVKKRYEDKKDTYSSIDDVIFKEYTLPLKIFKNSSISSFKESYKLMRYKEKASISRAFDLGIEMMFNYHLHPAIITACNSLNELDNYLDCMENNETSNFNYFKILFEFPPVLQKMPNRENS